MTGDDAYTILCALAGDDSGEFVSLFDVDSATAGDLAGLIKKQREENGHLRSQLAAASAQVALLRSKRGLPTSAALRAHLDTLDRLLALELPGPLEELRRIREQLGRD